MAAPKGNKFAEGNKGGRPNLFTTPESLLNAFKQYKEFVKSNPILVEDYVGKDAERVMRRKEQPLTMFGFEEWCFENNIAKGVEQYFSNRDGRYKEFMGICTHIKNSIKADQARGGMVGIYNSSLTARLVGVSDKTETKLEATIETITGMEIK